MFVAGVKVVDCSGVRPTGEPTDRVPTLSRLTCHSGPVQARYLPLTMSSTEVTAAAGTTDDNLLRQLQEWTQSSLTALYNLDQEPQTQALFTPDAQIIVNGDKLSPDQYDEQIKELRTAAAKIDTHWENIVAIPEDDSVRS
jgi:hypothetical protein